MYYGIWIIPPTYHHQVIIKNIFRTEYEVVGLVSVADLRETNSA